VELIDDSIIAGGYGGAGRSKRICIEEKHLEIRILFLTAFFHG